MSASGKLITWLEERLNLTEIFSFFSTFGLSYGEINLTKPLRASFKEAFQRKLPVYTQGRHQLGLLIFLLFGFQAITGLLLTFYYQPSTETAYESTVLIVREVTFGWFIHQLHYWGSNFLIVLLIVRLGRFFIDGVYKKPRELFWVFGAILFFLSTQEALTGTLLPWDQQAYWSVTRGLEVISALPLVGIVFAYIVGGLEISSAMLTRFYVLHVIVIPLLMLFFFYLHFATVRRVGLSSLSEDEAARPLYPDHLLRLAVMFLLLFGVVLTMSTIFPSPFWAKADPFDSPKGIRPLWFLMPAFSLLDLLPHWLAGSLLLLFLFGLIAFPFLERSAHRELKKRPVSAALALLFLLLVIVLMFIGYRRG